MICFPCWDFDEERNAHLNCIVHHLTSLAVDEIECEETYLRFIFPQHMLAEAKERCKLVVHELALWSVDNWHHHLESLHELALYGVLRYWQEDLTKESIPLFMADYSCLESALAKVELDFLSEECLYDFDFLRAEAHFRRLHEEGALCRYDLSDDDQLRHSRTISQVRTQACLLGYC